MHIVVVVVHGTSRGYVNAILLRTLVPLPLENSVFVQAETADMKPAWRMLTNSCGAATTYKCAPGTRAARSFVRESRRTVRKDFLKSKRAREGRGCENRGAMVPMEFSDPVSPLTLPRNLREYL